MSRNEKLPSIKKNYLYTLGFQILQIIVPFITTPYVSRVLGAEKIGAFSYVNATFLYFQLIAVLGIGTYSQVEAAKIRRNKKELSQFFAEVMTLRWITTGVSAIIYFVFIVFQKEYISLYAVEFIALFGYAIDVTWLYEGVENFKHIMIKNTAVKLLSIVCIFLFIKSTKDTVIYLLINVCGIFIGNASVIPYIKNYISLEQLERLHLKKHFQQTMVYFLPTIASTVLLTVDKLMLGYLTESKVYNGYYEQAIKIDTIVFSVFSSFYHTMRSRMAYLFSGNEEKEIKRLMKKTFNFIALLSIPVSIGIFVVSDFFVIWFFGKEYKPVIDLLKIMAPWLLIKPMSNCFLDQYLTPNGRQKTSNIIIWTGAVINLILNYFFINAFMARGAAAATLLSEVIMLLLSWVCCKDILSVGDWICISKKYLISGLGMLIILNIVSMKLKADVISTMILVAIGVAVYIGCLIILRDSFFLDQINSFVGKFKQRYRRGNQ